MQRMCAGACPSVETCINHKITHRVVAHVTVWQSRLYVWPLPLFPIFYPTCYKML